MSDELLGKGARALRETGAFDEEEAAIVRARILTTLGERKRRRARKVIVLVPLAAVLVATTALATTNEGFSGAIRSLAALIGVIEEAPARADRIEAAPKSSAPRMARPSEAADLAAPALDEIDEGETLVTDSEPALTEVPEVSPPKREAKSEKVAAAEPSPSPPVPETVPKRPADLSRFERAYQLHFVDKDYEHALLAWEGYLRTSPGGQLAVEARYNRAMALVRLGRHREARIALEPFARGVHGGYRQSEAQAILSALP